jgi:uncharacterized protein YmfQ (DUF2313 family)
MVLTESDYLRQMQALLPPGPAWPKDDDALLTRMLGALAAELARVDGRVRQLVDEDDPHMAAELLLDWERVAGLPDTCVALSGQTQSIAQRRAALVARLTMLGGQSKAYFIALAASLGYTVTITEFRPFRAGQSRSGDPVATNWQFAWQVNAPLNTVTPFRAGNAVAGDPINSWGNKLLECVLSRFKPAHTTVVFAYS